MSAATQGPHAGMADAVMSSIRGQQDAQRLLHVIRQGCAPADALLDAIQQVQATGDGFRMQGFVRVLQKEVERHG